MSIEQSEKQGTPLQQFMDEISDRVNAAITVTTLPRDQPLISEFTGLRSVSVWQRSEVQEMPLDRPPSMYRDRKSLEF